MTVKDEQVKTTSQDMINTLMDVERESGAEGRTRRKAIIAAIRRKLEWEVDVEEYEAERMKELVKYHERRAVVRARH